MTDRQLMRFYELLDEGLLNEIRATLHAIAFQQAVAERAQQDKFPGDHCTDQTNIGSFINGSMTRPTEKPRARQCSEGTGWPNNYPDNIFAALDRVMLQLQVDLLVSPVEDIFPGRHLHGLPHLDSNIGLLYEKTI
ncbi:hypothetical protein MCOR25_008361 [Pyricularia grisea]|uniref:Uncharacterized protein n=1 Tax=Pyricularia grisea TaxID=148305 RepID=A0A6P8B1W8_PYRGI|nr:uncharacterized protein PgNI_07305 [Pyricularia grisea]KAI6355055.1 hypothetical protein MCOR25_008361 [Pyricularia grisea]TLD08799.1 hypothetical protein PgNI_07305 [Pyricularia grisea]